MFLETTLVDSYWLMKIAGDKKYEINTGDK